MVESGQLDLVEVLREEYAVADEHLVTIEEQLSVQIDANPNDKLLMAMFDYITDARQSLNSLADLLTTMAERDVSETIVSNAAGTAGS